MNWYYSWVITLDKNLKIRETSQPTYMRNSDKYCEYFTILYLNI